MWVLLSNVLLHGHTCASTSSSSSLFFLLSDRFRFPTRNRSFSVFSKSVGPCKYVFIPLPSFNPPCISKCLSDFTLILSASLSLILLLSWYPPNFSADTMSSWFPPICFRTFSTKPYHLIPAPRFVRFSHTAPSAMADNFFFGVFFTWYFILPVQFLMTLFVSSRHTPSSALNAVLLVVLEHLCIIYLLSSVLFPTVLRSSRSLPILLLHILALVPSNSSG